MRRHSLNHVTSSNILHLINRYILAPTFCSSKMSLLIQSGCQMHGKSPSLLRQQKSPTSMPVLNKILDFMSMLSATEAHMQLYNSPNSMNKRSARNSLLPVWSLTAVPDNLELGRLWTLLSLVYQRKILWSGVLWLVYHISCAEPQDCWMSFILPSQQRGSCISD